MFSLNPYISIYVPTGLLPTCTHVRHTWQPMHRLHLPPWLWSQRMGANWAGSRLCHHGPTCAPPPGRSQVQCPRPPPGREGGGNYPASGCPPHTHTREPFIPGHARPQPRRLLPSPARSLVLVREDPAGGQRTRDGEVEASPVIVSIATPSSGVGCRVSPRSGLTELAF